MAHFHIKTKKGRPYLYIREIARVNGKPKVVSQVYLGSPEKVAKLAKGSDDGGRRLIVNEWGALWLADQIDQDVDIAGIVDEIVPTSKRETGPSVGEYFRYAVLNRMVEAVSKNQLPQWYSRTAIQEIRPVDVEQLTSQHYWDKWHRVTEEQLGEIARRFFDRVWGAEKAEADCLLFDTTNYFTFMASKTPSNLARRGKNKEGRDNLRQVGLGLLIGRGTRLPRHYVVYPGNVHDSRIFQGILDQAQSFLCGTAEKERLTVVVDKGMNSADNFAIIDATRDIRFVTTYSLHFAETLAAIPLDQYEPVTEALSQKQRDDDDHLKVYRTQMELWDKKRTVVMTFNPRTQRKQQHEFERKLDALREDLLVMRAKVRENAPQWRDAEAIRERYVARCEGLHLPTDLYELTFSTEDGQMAMTFAKSAYRTQQREQMFGKNLIVTDNHDWTTTEIVSASLDRFEIEQCFRQTKDDDLVGVQPIRHWTDSKIQCHLFTCVAAMTYLRRLELRLRQAGIQRTAVDVMADMQHLHSVLAIPAGARSPRRSLETPSKTQTEVLRAFNREIDGSGVLHVLGR